MLINISAKFHACIRKCRIHVISISTKRAIIYNSLTAVKLNRDAAKTIFIIWAQAKNDLANLCYNILATYCTNTPLIYSRPVTCIVANYVCYSSVMRTHGFQFSTVTNSHKIDFQGWSSGNMSLLIGT